MIDKSNPAGRLHEILAQAAKNADQVKTREVWASVLDCEVEDDAEITRRVVEVYGLTQEVERLVRLIPDLNHDLYLASFDRLEKAFFPLHLQNPWGQSKNALAPDVLTRLQFCAEELGKHYTEEAVDSEALDEIAELVATTFEAVEFSEIDPALRLALLETLEGIRHALATYRIHGAKGVKEALQSLLGSVVVNNEGLVGLKGQNDDVLARLGKLIDSLDSFTSRAMKLTRILAGPASAALKFLTDEADAADA